MRGLAFVAVLALIRTASADSFDLTKMIPELQKLPAPTWVKPGARITWYTTEHKTQGDPRRPVPAAASGYSQFYVAAVGKRRAYVMNRKYIAPTQQEHEAQIPSRTTGMSLNAAGNPFWIHPAALRAAVAGKGVQGTTIQRVKRMVNGKEYTGVEFASQKDQASLLYDEKSGILLQLAKSIPPSQDNAGPGGNTMEFRGFSQARYPWLNAPMPQWTKNVHVYRYEGSMRMMAYKNVPGAQSTAIGLTHRRTGVGANWFTTHVEPHATKAGSKPPSFTSVTGLGAFGLVLPPKALAELKPGTVLDRNKFAQSETKVLHVGNYQGRRVAIFQGRPYAGW